MENNKNLEIEKIAWQVFLTRTGLSFKRELTSDEKKQVTDVDSYEYYRTGNENLREKTKSTFK